MLIEIHTTVLSVLLSFSYVDQTQFTYASNEIASNKRLSSPTAQEDSHAGVYNYMCSSFSLFADREWSLMPSMHSLNSIKLRRTHRSWKMAHIHYQSMCRTTNVARFQSSIWIARTWYCWTLNTTYPQIRFLEKSNLISSKHVPLTVRTRFFELVSKAYSSITKTAGIWYADLWLLMPQRY